MPGFSTKEVVTETSGRGVGLDSLNHEIEKLGGAIEVESDVDIGSTFTITLRRKG